MPLTTIIDVLFPKCCFGCDNHLLRNQDFLCVQCLHQLPFTFQHLHSENEAHQRFHGRLRLKNCSCLLYFTKTGFVQQVFHHLKYKNQPQISYYLGQIYASQLTDCPWLQTVDIIIPVPLHTKKQSIRGYNQVNGFAEALSDHFNIPIDYHLLTQDIYTVSQTRKNLFERTKTNQLRFNIHAQPLHQGKHFLILDDILTTGGTLESCGKKILEIPNSSISVLCLAQTQ
ncbi:ComF family protein [Flavobacterium sp. NKUCC04_CG]|uniref:ComF family protein n=1 Tax=Flavobacterium sp. NKUCC04_CG TaxID=2842121 RepID=UPI001C5AFDB0|nr:phosphoribosyltransferase family protein [Flavobacterium sp. NKUCC04_CG]MBW3518501.1 ComF family protein [Flavobacterium sp. NKUCC04_CG]